MTRILSGLFFLTGAYAGCVAVTGDRIEARDLEIPALRDSREFVGLSPAPGAIRRIPARQIANLLKRPGVKATVTEGVCVVRSVQPLPPGEVVKALAAALDDDRVSIALVDYRDTSVPAGRLDFSREGLVRRGGGEPDLWRGRLIYGEGKTLPVTARVHLSIERRVLVAARDVAAGAVLSPEHIRVETLRMHPFAEAVEESTRFEGAITRRRLAAGAPLQKSDLYLPPLVKSGDRLTLEAREGAARLVVAVRAESSGHEGDRIVVRNLHNGRRIQARVQGRNTVVPFE